MLIINRKPGEKLYLGETICITVIASGPEEVRFRVEAPRDLPIYRQEHLPLYAEPPNPKIEACVNWLRKFLNEHAYPSAEIQSAAERDGYSWLLLREARKILIKGGELANRNFGGGRGLSNDWWSGLGPPEQWVKRPEAITVAETTFPP